MRLWTAALALAALQQLRPCVSLAQPSIAVVSPAPHASLRVDPLTGVAPQIVVELAIHDFRVPEDGVIHISGEKLGEGYSDGVVVDQTPRFVTLNGVELGSHFWTFALRHANGSAVLAPAARTTLHVEVVLPQDTALPQWHYTPTRAQRRPKILFNPQNTRSPGTTIDQRRRLCLIGLLDVFDGQRKMWSQVIAALPPQEWDVRFLTFGNATSNSTFARRLRELNVSIRGSKLIVHEDDLEPYGLSPSQAIPAAIQAFQDTFQGIAPDRISMDIFRQQLPSLHPPFTARLWETYVDVLHETCEGAVLVIANSRDISDQALVIGGRIAGVRAVVMEMTNLRPVPLHVDALVAPSHYALQHPSTTESVTARQRYVLNTGVNTTHFRPAAVEHQSARVTFTVGYVGRLATDKSVGLVIQVARLLAQECPLTCRVRIIGDGILREHLETLVSEWRLGRIVHFTGGIFSESALIREIQRVDVGLSPCFHETFGIAPLEAMSCGVPVVSFASGGVHEYLEHNVNGLVVHEPTAEALYDAVLSLRNDEDLRQRLGVEARRTVVGRFSDRVGVQQFVRLYERLAQS